MPAPSLEAARKWADTERCSLAVGRPDCAHTGRWTGNSSRPAACWSYGFALAPSSLRVKSPCLRLMTNHLDPKIISCTVAPERIPPLPSNL